MSTGRNAYQWRIQRRINSSSPPQATISTIRLGDKCLLTGANSPSEIKKLTNRNARHAYLYTNKTVPVKQTIIPDSQHGTLKHCYIISVLMKWNCYQPKALSIDRAPIWTGYRYLHQAADNSNTHNNEKRPCIETSARCTYITLLVFLSKLPTDAVLQFVIMCTRCQSVDRYRSETGWLQQQHTPRPQAK